MHIITKVPINNNSLNSNINNVSNNSCSSKYQNKLHDVKSFNFEFYLSALIYYKNNINTIIN